MEKSKSNKHFASLHEQSLLQRSEEVFNSQTPAQKMKIFNEMEKYIQQVTPKKEQYQTQVFEDPYLAKQNSPPNDGPRQLSSSMSQRSRRSRQGRLSKKSVTSSVNMKSEKNRATTPTPMTNAEQ